MKSIHIRDIDPGVLNRLKVLARLHHRSMQGEVKAILEDASRRAPAYSPKDDLDIITVAAEGSSTWRREDIYDDPR